MRPIKKKFWLTLREAAKVIGRATCGEKWSDDLVNKPKDPRHQAMRKDLYAALSSCEVPALLDNGIRRFQATPEHVLDPCFTLHISKNWVSLGQVPGEKLRIWIHAGKLVQFLKSNQRFRSSAVFKKDLESKCLDWLDKLMRRHERPPEGRVKRDYQKQALEKFPGLSKRAFARAWEEANKQTGATGWSQGGRPKKRSHKT
jgi:hypothetical protein